MILDRIGRLRFLGFKLGETMPDRNAIRLFREKPAKAGAFRRLFDDCEEQFRAKGREPGKGRTADATVVSAPRRRMTDEEKAGAKKGESASRIWSDKPSKARRKDADPSRERERERSAATGNPEKGAEAFRAR